LCLRAGLTGLVLSVFELDSAEFVGEPQNLIGAFLDTRFSPSSSRVACLEMNGRILVLDSRTGRVVSSSIAHSSNLIWVDWHPDGRRLLTAGHDDQVLVWDAETGLQLLGPIRTPDGIVRVARWSPDGRFIVTRNDAREVRLWDGATGEAVTPPLKHDGEVAFARMTQPDRLMTASYPDQLRAWDLRESALPADVLGDYAQLVAGRQLSATGALLVLPPEKLAALARSLPHRAPELFR
jgi:WD40 repeat protein